MGKLLKMALALLGIGLAGMVLWLLTMRIDAITAAGTSVAPFFLTAIAAAILVVMGIVISVLRSARKSSSEEDLADDEPGAPAPIAQAAAPLSATALRKSFQRAVRLLKHNVTGKNFRYEIPWFLMLGAAGSGKTTALSQSGLNLPLGDPLTEQPEGSPCNFYFFERGIVLDIAGDMVLRADGYSSDERPWHLLLRLLQKHRQQRPIDGVVLTVSCAELLAEDAGASRISQSAAKLYQKLWQAQKILGLRFPVYILVTQCDRIQGFQSFCKTIPAPLAGSMLGWSSPYALDASFSSAWTDEAFEQIQANLRQSQFELFTQRIAPEESDGLFQFPTAFQQLADPLKHLLDIIFKQSAYHEAFFFRGLFFCGESGLQSAPAPETYFVKDLLENKAFPESGLSRPIRRSLLLRNRLAVAAQVTLAAMIIGGSLGLWRDYQQARVDRKALLPVLTQISQDMKTLRADLYQEQSASLQLYQMSRQRSQAIPFENSALNLFRGMTNIRSLTYVFIPSSWFSDLHQRIRKSMVCAYDEVILKALYIQLLQKAKAIFNIQETVESTQKERQILWVKDMPEFSTLSTFIANLKALEINAQLYNGLRSSRNLNDLGRVVKYLFGIELPEGFYQNAQYYHEALGETRYRVFNPRIYRLKAKEFTVKRLVDALYERIFAANPIRSYLRQLAVQLDGFSQARQSHALGTDRIRALMEAIARTKSVLKRPELQWVSGRALDLGSDFDAMMNAVAQSRFLGPDLSQEIESEGQADFKKLQADLLSQRTAMTGPLLERNPHNGRFTLSSSVQAMETDIDTLMGESFMKPAPGSNRLSLEIPPRSSLVWDIGLLKQAVDLIDPYQGFVREGLASFPSSLQQVIASTAQNNLEKQVFQKIAEAQHFSPLENQFGDFSKEALIKTEIRNFKEASPLLSRLLTSLNQLGLSTSGQTLAAVVQWQISSLLSALDDFLNADDLYAPKGDNFAWWQGNPGLSLQAYQAADTQELKNYLTLQRERIRHLAKTYAAPIVDFSPTGFLRSDRQTQQRLFKWERILVALNGYGNKKPANSVGILESFILKGMDAIRPDNYFQKLPPSALHAHSSDFFLECRDRLQRLLYARCQQLARAKAHSSYRRLADFFNDKLAGNFPFAPATEPVAGQASPGDIRDFYTRFDASAPFLRQVFSQDHRKDPGMASARDFLGEMAKVRQFFASFLKPDDHGNLAPVPAFDVSMAFRVNRSHEMGGNQIIGWQMTLADHTYSIADTNPVGRWRAGDPVVVSLRWAKNSTVEPVFAGQASGIQISGRTVRYRFSGQWSLLLLLERYAASPGDFTGLVDSRPNTLRFQIETKHVVAGEPSGKMTPAQVYIRLRLKTPDKNQKVLRLPFFPHVAPPLHWNNPAQPTG